MLKFLLLQIFSFFLTGQGQATIDFFPHFKTLNFHENNNEIRCVKATSHLSHLHEFHVSTAEIEHRSDQNTMTIVLHLFIDDLELTLKNLGHDSLYIATEKEHAKADAIIAKYINDHLSISSEKTTIEFDFLGKEPSEDLMAIYCYLEATSVPDFSSLNIENRLLLETFTDQKNITSFLKASGKKQHFLFSNGDEVQKVKL